MKVRIALRNEGEMPVLVSIHTPTYSIVLPYHGSDHLSFTDLEHISFSLGLRLDLKAVESIAGEWKQTLEKGCPSSLQFVYSSQGKIRPPCHQTKLVNSRSSVGKRVQTRPHWQAAITHCLQWNKRKLLQQQWLVKEGKINITALIPLR